MKRFIAISLFLLPALFACVENTEDVTGGATSVVLNQDKVDLMVGESFTLTARVLPESIKMDVVWSVLDSEYAEVKDGTVTGKSVGVTYVVATSADGFQKAACMVSVNPPIKYNVSLLDGLGQPVEAIYGYPGMAVQLSAVTSDGESGHSFTWSVDDTSAATVDSDGFLTFGTKAASDPAYVYYAQTYVKVVSEDGLGCRVPVVSSMLKGVSVDGVYQPAGSPAIVQANGRYTLSVLCQGAEQPNVIPADAVELELSNNTDFSIMKVGDTFTMFTGMASLVTSKLSACARGAQQKVEIAELKIDKYYPVKAMLVAASSSTLVFTWTEGISEADDISKPYTITLYSDEGCTEEVLSYNISAGNECWRGVQPRFVFTGLKPATNYWFKVRDTGGSEDLESAVINGTTAPFVIVEPDNSPAEVGDILLAEDFSELYWMADEVNQAAGYDVGSNNMSSFQDRTVDSFVGFTGSFGSPERIITAQSSAKKASGLRLGKWAQGYTARLYVGPGYVFLGTTKYVTHLITPPLNNIPEGASAKLTVTVHAAGYKGGNEAILAVQSSGTSFNAIGSNTQTNKNKLDLTTNFQTFTYTGGITTLGEFTVTLDGVKKGDRIAFGPTKEDNEVSNTAHMMLISDMTIQLTEINQ